MLPSRIFFDNFLDDMEPKKIDKMMKCDIYEENNMYHIVMDAPGFKKEDIKIEFEKGNRESLRKCISNLYQIKEKESFNKQNEDMIKQKKETAAVLLFDSILNEAKIRSATDIHIENGCVKLRVKGRLEKIMELQNERCLELIQRIKVLAGMNVIEKRRCQDGNFIYGNKNPIFLRVSSMGVVGEKKSGNETIVIRLLDTSRIPLNIDLLGFNNIQLEKMVGKRGIISLSNGLVIVCGPTGSGKSTTISSLLVEIEKKNQGSLKIISLEDPPEYIIPGITQIKIDENNSFSEALNHIFRQDPDVIMIGEIRDENSAAVAIRASLTGHLVFATLHCGNAVESILRLENLGIDRNILCQVLRAVICQELNNSYEKPCLYADLAIPKRNFHVEAIKTSNEDYLEKLMDHYTNYREVIYETMKTLKTQKKNVAELSFDKKVENDANYDCGNSDDFDKVLYRKNRKNPIYRRRNEDDGIHKSII